MRKRAFALALAAAAGLAGCGGGTPIKPYTSDRDAPLPPGQGMLGDALTWRSTRAPSATSATVDDQEEFRKWRQSAGNAERQEFEEWRAWQEWKRNNPKK
jgi:ABC-type glycerol-3-phosphate transport system substrate-binding protein